jgi:hypothetical protein
MEYTVIKVGAFLKWIFPAALGAGIAVWTNKGVIGWDKLIMFLFGTGAALIVGGGIIDYYDVNVESIKGVMYFGCGIWGIGIIKQINNRVPLWVQAKLDKWFT